MNNLASLSFQATSAYGVILQARAGYLREIIYSSALWGIYN